MHARTGRHHASPLAEVRHDARDGAALGGGRQRDDGLAAARFGCAAVEIHLPADAGEKLRPDGIGAHLAGKVYLQRGIDRDHLVLLADDGRVVDVLRRLEGEEWIVVNVIVNPPRADGEAGDDFAMVRRLARAVDGARLDQLNNAVGDHLRVNAEVFLVLEEAKHRLRNAPDAELNGGTVFHQRGDVFGDLPGRLGDFSRRHFQNRRLRRHQHVNVMGVDGTIPERPRHVRVHLRDDERGIFGGALHNIHRHAQAAHAVRVRRRDVDEGHVERELAGVKQARDVRQVDGRVVAQAFLDDVAHVLGDEEAVHAEVLRQFLVRIRRVAESEQMDNFGVRQFGGAFAEGADQFQRLAGAGADEHALAGPDFFYRLGCREDLQLVSLLPVGIVGDGLTHVLCQRLKGSCAHRPRRLERPPGRR